MAYMCKLWFSVCLISYGLKFMKFVDGAPQVPCFFVFGDSLADTGNNNDLKTTAKANFPPYGVDFRGGPTGRFTNGRNFADIISELLGFPNYPPTFLTAKDKNVSMGVNYASGGAGIFPETGQNLGEIFSFDAQLRNHNVTISRLNSLQRDSKKATAHLNKCIYLVGFGSNDYINNYLMPQLFPSSRQYKPDQFAENLMKRYSTQLTELYNYGARKMVLFGIGDIGCTPALAGMAPTSRRSAEGCVVAANDAVKQFNDRFKPLIDSLNKQLTGATVVYVNTTHINTGNPAGSTTPIPCCKISKSTNGMCIPKQVACGDRGAHAFFDAFHPTEKAMLPTAMRAYKSTSPIDVYPMDILHLAQLQT